MTSGTGCTGEVGALFDRFRAWSTSYSSDVICLVEGDFDFKSFRLCLSIFDIV